MGSKLSPVSAYRERAYPKVESPTLQRLLLLVGMTATSLGGCGPAIDSRTVDRAIDEGDLDGAVDCDANPEAESCTPADASTE
ncbi:MAG TPA: hypothetical protein PLJ27_12480 [Polyangiaceae bacterium]|nr:MAG: hypothetical protein BWY17_00528 [Deltaproteobacteria bacterium ADurb.Bin207]HOT11376.1 hypothetical protein [Polyangiaceae bacterium]HQF22154.1 hypothetical protein [Polyangiaceae bacterium]HQK18270.1 hypothetical protein [Polyangiaceae bacterium]HQM10119.1 hypothetical protein [Polyangiaceae bacterium]